MLEPIRCPDAVECRASDYPCKPGECLIERRSALLREQIRMWKRTAHIFGIGLIMMAIAMGALGISDLMR